MDLLVTPRTKWLQALITAPARLPVSLYKHLKESTRKTKHCKGKSHWSPKPKLKEEHSKQGE